MTSPLSVGDALARDGGRYSRQALVPWWDQQRVATARVLVVGAGALGNEVVKNLALLGVGTVLLVDMDRIETSNLARAVLFRSGDEGRYKAHAVAERAEALNADTRVIACVKNAVHGLGLGAFAWADVVIGAVDNREARVFVSSACARVGRKWVDGAIEGLAGIVRGFDPRASACYECTMGAVDRQLLAERRSCAMLARRAVESGRVPSTAVTASVIGGLQAQEAVKILHDQPALLGEGLHVDGLWDEWSRVRYPRVDDCPGHDAIEVIEPLGAGIADLTIGALLDRGRAALGGPVTLDFSRDVVLELSCPSCGRRDPGRAVLGAVTEDDARCPDCWTHRIVDAAASASDDGPVDRSRTLADLGLPPWDVVVARRGASSRVGWLFDADAAAVLGAQRAASPGAPSREES